MRTLAQRHYERTLAAGAVEPAAGMAPADATAYELMLAQLAEDRRRLKAIQSVERKIALKRDLLPRYEAWIAGRLDGDRGGQDDVFMTCLVWQIDVGHLDTALRLAEHALRHGLTPPDPYKRDTATLVAEEIAERALAPLTDGAEPVPLAILERALALTAAHDMPDEVRAKLHKAAGLRAREHAPAPALEHLRRALQLHERIGVKKEIEQLERELKKAGDTG